MFIQSNYDDKNSASLNERKLIISLNKNKIQTTTTTRLKNQKFVDFSK